MTSNSVIAVPTTVPAASPILGIATRLLVEPRGADGVRTAAQRVGEGNAAVDALVETARCNVEQLRLLIGLVDPVANVRVVVLDVYDLARSFGACHAGAVGAAASLLELTALGDEREMGEHLAAALDLFGAEELIVAAAALTAALSTSIADWLDIDPRVAHAEVVRVLGCRSPRTSQRRLRRTFERRRPLAGSQSSMLRR